MINDVQRPQVDNFICRAFGLVTLSYFDIIVQSIIPFVILTLEPLRAGITVAVKVPLIDVDVSVVIFTVQLEPVLVAVAKKGVRALSIKVTEEIVAVEDAV